jgi:flagellar FliL protein
MTDQAAPQTEETPPADAPKKGGGKVAIIALVASLAIGGAVGVFVTGPLFARQRGYVVATADSAHEGSEGGEGEHGKKGEKDGPKTVVHSLDNLVLNPAGSSGTRFLMVNVAIEVKDDKITEEMNNRDAEARDAVLRVLGAKTVDELTDIAKREGIKKEVQDALMVLFPKDAIRRLYFPQFVIQ